MGCGPADANPQTAKSAPRTSFEPRMGGGRENDIRHELHPGLYEDISAECLRVFGPEPGWLAVYRFPRGYYSVSYRLAPVHEAVAVDRELLERDDIRGRVDYRG